MSWTFIFLMVGLKIPILGLLYIVWWAIRSGSEAVPPASADDGGTKDRHPRPPRPRRPRRGPHAEPDPASPRRVRTTLARSR
ncbi:MAG: hypothetical protein NTV40_03385 [Solirubrobacterales bacterium]|nr:hypothetical protein [Solirubrobacterales bacterium]